jgi:RNA polymerase sigma-70 factor (ECF subfamily)
MNRSPREQDFRGWLPEPARAAWSEPQLARLAARVDEVHAAWPALAVSDVIFVPYLVERLPPAPDDAAIDALHSVDLYLACGCAQGDAGAIDSFERLYAAELRAACARTGGSSVDVEEIAQRVRRKLFADVPPGIASYAGRGALVGWLRVVASREALDGRARASRERATERDFFEAMVAGDDSPEVAFLKHSLGAELKAVVLAALEELSNRERSLLRYAYCDGKNVDEIARIFRVHRATAARWVCSAREQLVDRTYTRLNARYGGSRSEIGSIVRLGMTVIDTTFAKYLVARR